MKRSKPTYTFRHTVSPVYYVSSCADKLAEESRGLMGCHAFTRCPACVLTFAGWEFWGENGHLQGTAKTRDQLIAMLKHKARQLTVTSGKDCCYPIAGAFIGNTFTKGAAIYYRG